MTPSILDIPDQHNSDPKNELTAKNTELKLKIDDLARDLEGFGIGD